VFKTVIFSFQVDFTGDFILDCPFKLCFLAVQVQTLTHLFSLTVPNFVVFFKLLYDKFNEHFKNVLKTVFFSLQVGLTINFL